MNKDLLRKIYRDQRSCLNKEDKILASEKLYNNFLKFISNFSNLTNIAAYNAIDGEIDISTLMDYFNKTGSNIFVPICELDEIYFKPDHKFNINTNIKYRSNDLTDNIDDLNLDMIITPLVACDKKGNRLGFGGGFYDKKIAKIKEKAKKNNFCEPHIVGVCYDFQICDEIPIQNHDQKLSYVVSDKRIIIVN